MDVYFQEFQKYDYTGLNFQDALSQCKKRGIRRLVVEPGVYELTPETCAQAYLSVSNHGCNGLKKIGIFIDGMEDFEIDFSGSTLLCAGAMIPIAILNSKHISIRNLILKNTRVQVLQTTVTAHGEGWIDTKPLADGNLVRISNGQMYAACPDGMCAPLEIHIEFNGRNGEIEAGTMDDSLGVWSGNLRFAHAEDGALRIHGVKRYPPLGNVLVFSCARRLACGVFCENSSDVFCEQIDLCSCYGMGFLAQMCRDITLSRVNTVRADGHLYTACADATHFVCCEGVVRVENCSFEGQLDDALNIHGIYTKIVQKGDGWILVRQMHEQSTGIRIYRKGDTLEVLHPKTLLPYQRFVLEEAEYINDSFIKLYMKASTEHIAQGDVIENLSRYPDLIFCGNQVRDNRARGMLLATKGKVQIEKNVFHTSGPAILFECDGESWYESGSAGDVSIRENRFDQCKYGGWGSAVIECKPRSEVEEGKYFHKNIRIEENTFIPGHPCLAQMDNAEYVTFWNNTIMQQKDCMPCIRLSHVKEQQIQKNIAKNFKKIKKM